MDACQQQLTKDASSARTITMMNSPPNRKHLTFMDPAILHYFPQLECQIVNEAKFPGINALEFFEVYFTDDAPYSFKEYQLTTGDIDVKYGKWMRMNEDDEYSTQQTLHPGFVDNKSTNDSIKFPTSSRKERELHFKTLTKSKYFA